MSIPEADHPSYTEGYEFALDWKPGDPLPTIDMDTEEGQEFEAGLAGGMLRNDTDVRHAWEMAHKFAGFRIRRGVDTGDLFGTILRANHGDKVEAGIEVAKGLMRGDETSHKAGYTKENAVLAVKDLYDLDDEQTGQVRQQLPDDE